MYIVYSQFLAVIMSLRWSKRTKRKEVLRLTGILSFWNLDVYTNVENWRLATFWNDLSTADYSRSLVEFYFFVIFLLFYLVFENQREWCSDNAVFVQTNLYVIWSNDLDSNSKNMYVLKIWDGDRGLLVSRISERKTNLRNSKENAKLGFQYIGETYELT